MQDAEDNGTEIVLETFPTVTFERKGMWFRQLSIGWLQVQLPLRVEAGERVAVRYSFRPFGAWRAQRRTCGGASTSLPVGRRMPAASRGLKRACAAEVDERRMIRMSGAVDGDVLTSDTVRDTGLASRMAGLNLYLSQSLHE